MKNSKQSRELIRQNEQTVTSSQKHDANLQKNSTLYFQVGLIVCLLAALGLLEMRFETSIPNYVENTMEPDGNFDMAAPNFKVYVEPIAEIKPKAKEKKVILNKPPKIVENDHVITKALNIETPDSFTPREPFDPDAVNIEKPTDNILIDFISIEEAPIYPGCEKAKGTDARKKCMSDKINRLVRKKFNSNIASDYGLTGVQKIYVEFQVDKSGKVKDIKTRAPHPKLQEEAERVINKIPEMQPGMQRDKPVGVRYTLPIIFQAN